MQLFQGNSLLQSIGKGSDSSITYQFRGIPQDPFVFRYFMVIIERNFKEFNNGDDCLQFSKLQFIDKNENSFIYPIDKIKIDTPNNDAVEGEEPKDLLINDNSIVNFGKCCFRSDDISYPVKIKFDLGSECLNTHIYNRWHWFTSNDTADQKEGTRNPRDFSLWVSNSGIMDDNNTFWKNIDSFNGDESDYHKWITNRTLAYTSKEFQI